MLIPIPWLRDYVSFDLDVAALAERLTMAGLEVEEIHETADGTVLDIYVTPNRGDCLSLVGVAREVAAITGGTWRGPEFRLRADGPAEPGLTVTIEDPDLCPRYAARVIRGVKVGESPAWLQGRLRAAGLRPISGVVDVTNYVMLELGQPLHAFDLSTLREGRIGVRRARPNETITTIDGTAVMLEPDMLVIADAGRPVAIAGVMGGLETEVTASTTDLLLESAHFSPASVRRTARRIPLSTPASYRFERSVDPEGVVRAVDRAAQLITELAGGEVSRTLVDAYPRRIGPAQIGFRPRRCDALLGVAVPDAQMSGHFERLGFTVERADSERWKVTVPTFRPDLTLEADLVEEVARLYGYQALPETLPAGVAGVGSISPLGRLAERLREQLLAQGMYEALTNTLTSLAWLERCRLSRSPVWPAPSTAPPVPGPLSVVRLRNPLSEEWAVLRPSLLPGLLQAAVYNAHRGQENLFLFEVGWAHIQPAGDEAPRDRFLAAGLMSGSRWNDAWNLPREATSADFYTTKGVAEAIARDLGVTELRWSRSSHPALHPGRAAEVAADNRIVGVAGELHPEVAAALDLRAAPVIFELDAQALMELGKAERRYQPPSRYPALTRDLAPVVPRGTPGESVRAVFVREAGELARAVRLFDVYTGPPLPEDRVSLAFSLDLAADDRTLTDSEADQLLARLRDALTRECQAEFR
jgi:phenylalanyl-tRNA synthetase beta chain